MNQRFNPGPLSPVINSLLQELTQGANQKRSDLVIHWPEIVGKRFSEHTKPTLGTGGSVCVWVDDSVLAYELSQRYRGTLLKRLDALLGEGTIKKIIFRVGQIR